MGQTLIAVSRAIGRFVRAKLDIWEHRRAVDQNVLLARSVTIVWRASIKNVETRVQALVEVRIFVHE